METVYLGLGSNLGERETMIQKAIQQLSGIPHTFICSISSIYETAPVGYLEQPHFLNLVVGVKTALSPEQLFDYTQKIENEMGRKRGIRWGPRTLDIDILLFGNRRMMNERLEIPHPRMTERAFVMIPLAEIAPDLKIPGNEETVSEMAGRLNKDGVRKWGAVNRWS